MRPAGALLVGGGLIALAVGPRAADARASQPWFDIQLASGLVPTAAIRFTEREGLRQRMYNDLEVGSYLTWDGWPRFRVFQDPRINGYPPEFHAVLKRADLTRTEWQALMDRYALTAALITYPAVNPRGALFDPERWALVYRTDEALVFARRVPQNAARIAALEIPVTFGYDREHGLVVRALAEPPAGAHVDGCQWSLRLGDFYIEQAPADLGRAREAYRAAAVCLDWSRTATLAGLELQLGDPGASARLWHGVPGSEARVREGYALLKMGRAAEALAAFEAGAGAADGDDSDDGVLGRALALEALGRDGEALAAFRLFLRRAPNHVAATEARGRAARLEARVSP